MEILPKREKSRIRKLWDELENMRQITAQKGPLLPYKFAAELCGVSGQRVRDLVEESTLESVAIGGHPFVTEASLVAWASSPRKAGRPRLEVAGIPVSERGRK